jgi:hypothetical protein
MSDRNIKFLVILFIFLASHITGIACDTTTRLKLNSSGYSGQILVELRKGNRPGSRVINKDVIITSGQRDFLNVCPGRYFFSFATADSPTISVTSYFDVESNLELAEMTVFLSRTNDPKGNRVQTIKKNEL